MALLNKITSGITPRFPHSVSILSTSILGDDIVDDDDDFVGVADDDGDGIDDDDDASAFNIIE